MHFTKDSPRYGEKPIIVGGKKLCPKCNIWKPVETFSSRGIYRDHTKRYGYCKPCHVEYQHEKRLEWIHNITQQESDAILAWQDDKCAICKKPQLQYPKRFAIDHDHKTGLIRGRLCSFCNRIISFFHDNPIKLQAAVDYLINPPAKQIIGDRIVKRQQKRHGGFKKFEPKQTWKRNSLYG